MTPKATTVEGNTLRNEFLRNKYGDLLSLEDIATILKYPSVTAIKRAHKRGTLPVKLFKFPNRRKLFTVVTEVSRALDKLEEDKQMT